MGYGIFEISLGTELFKSCDAVVSIKDGRVGKVAISCSILMSFTTICVILIKRQVSYIAF